MIILIMMIVMVIMLYDGDDIMWCAMFCQQQAHRTSQT